MNLSSIPTHLSQPVDPAAREKAKLKEACADFEALMINRMLTSMKSSLPGNPLFGDSLQKDIYESLFYQEISTKIARENGLGLGDRLYRELGGKYEAAEGGTKHTVRTIA